MLQPSQQLRLGSKRCANSWPVALAGRMTFNATRPLRLGLCWLRHVHHTMPPDAQHALEREAPQRLVGRQTIHRQVRHPSPRKASAAVSDQAPPGAGVLVKAQEASHFVPQRLVVAGTGAITAAALQPARFLHGEENGLNNLGSGAA